MAAADQTRAEWLAQELNGVRDRITEVRTYGDSKPNYSIDGQSVKWKDYLAYLHQQEAELTRELERESGDDIVEEQTTWVTN